MQNNPLTFTKKDDGAQKSKGVQIELRTSFGYPVELRLVKSIIDGMKHDIYIDVIPIDVQA